MGYMGYTGLTWISWISHGFCIQLVYNEIKWGWDFIGFSRIFSAFRDLRMVIPNGFEE